MKVEFIAAYYSLVTDDIIRKKIYADTIEDAYNQARKERPSHCSEDFDLYIDCLMIESAVVDNGLGERKVI